MSLTTTTIKCLRRLSLCGRLWNLEGELIVGSSSWSFRQLLLKVRWLFKEDACLNIGASHLYINLEFASQICTLHSRSVRCRVACAGLCRYLIDSAGWVCLLHCGASILCRASRRFKYLVTQLVIQ